MVLEPYDIGTFLVSSDGINFYLVDPEENNGWGFCGCWDWENRCGPKISKKEPGRKICKHVRWVREVLKQLTIYNK